MKRKNLSVAIVLVVLLTMAVGYALFSQTINITGTATAHGDFEVEVTCDMDWANSNYKSINETEYDLTFVPEGGATNTLCSVSGDTLSFSATLSYPGARKYYVIRLHNIGSIDATYKNSEVSISQDKFCIDGSKKTNANNTADGTITEASECYNLLTENLVQADSAYAVNMVPYEDAAGIAYFEDDHGNVVTFNDSGISTYVERTNNDIIFTIPAGHSLYVAYSLELPSTFGENGTISSYLITHQRTMTVNIRQAN